MCVLSLFEFFSSMHDKDILMAFIFCHLNTKFCSRSLPFVFICDMISQAVPVIETMTGLEKPIKTFWYKRGCRLASFVQEKVKCDGSRRVFSASLTLQRWNLSKAQIIKFIILWP